MRGCEVAGTPATCGGFMISIGGSLLRAWPYVILLLLVPVLLFGLKIMERSYTMREVWVQQVVSRRVIPPLPPTRSSVFTEGMAGRAEDVSFWYVVGGLFSILMITRAVPAVLNAGGRLSAVRLSFWVVLVLLGLIAFEWGLYLQAVYRDNGTFFYLRLPHPSVYPQVHIIQVLEGLLNLTLLALLMTWGVIGHILASLLGRLDRVNRDKQREGAACDLAAACLIPVFLLGAATIVGIVVDWSTGIANVAKARGTAIAMWLVFVVLFGRIFVKSWHVVKWRLSWPPCEPR
jgi:hypothetical protein